MNLPRPETNPGLVGYGALVDRVIVRVFGRAGGLLMTKRTAKELVDEVFVELAKQARTDRISVPRFGTFSIRRMKPRRIRNPKTRELMELGKHWALGFQASKHQKGEGDGP